MRGKFRLRAAIVIIIIIKINTIFSTALPSCFSSPLCAVFLCFHTNGCEANSFTTDGYRIFNMRINLRACRTHRGGGGQAQTSLHESWRRELWLTLPRQGIEPRVFRFEFQLKPLSYFPSCRQTATGNRYTYKTQNSFSPSAVLATFAFTAWLCWARSRTSTQKVSLRKWILFNTSNS